MISIIKNGTVYEPEKNRLCKRNIWIEEGKIRNEPEAGEQYEEIEAGGCYVLPALVDSHVHVNRENGGIGANADTLCIPNGIQIAVDAGSLGADDIESFITREILRYDTKVFALIHAASEGQRLDQEENLQSGNIKAERIMDLYHRYSHVIRGIKIRYEESLIRNLGLEPLKKCLKISEKLEKEGFRCPVTVHLGPLGGSVSLAELMSYLRPGDVLAHVFQSRGETIFDGNGILRKEITDARSRGVLFDFAHGRMNFTFQNVRTAGKQDFWPDLLGTDIHNENVYKFPAFSAMNTMTMMNALGMPLERIFLALTRTPALVWNFEDSINQFRAGDSADISIIREQPSNRILTDREGTPLPINSVFSAKTVIRAGRILYAEV